MPNSDPKSRAGTSEPEPVIRANYLRNRLRNVIHSVVAQKVGYYKNKDINYNEDIQLKYPALSYHLGDDDAVHKIYIYNEEFGEEWDAVWPFSTRFIQKNLRVALLQLRSEQDEVHLWCDAICINQANNKEKAAQVARMHEVYTFAKSFCIWLGISDEQGATNDPKRTFSLLRSVLNLEVLDRFVDRKDDWEDWMLIINLMKNDWFTRRWVIQELALAKNASIRYADQEMKWTEFADAVALFMMKLPRMKHILNQSMSTDFEKLRKPAKYLGALDARALGANTLVTATSRLFRRSDDGRIEQRLSSLEILVSSLLLTFEAIDPRDTIFAILAIAKDTGNLGSKLDPGRRWLDSERRREYYIEKSNSLDILCRHWAPRPKLKNTREKVESTFEDEKMPSWITSIDQYAFGSPREAKNGRINEDSFVDESGRPQYNACSRLAPRIRFGKKNHYDLKDDEIDPINPSKPGVKPVYARKQEDIPLRLKFDDIVYAEGFQLDVIKNDLMW
ncbi:hypothetical protein BPAE_0038g00270 [Botrytis paeoniae]|uniref:Heterokaryon incompatibility domain-containing protein n=1 Tax=Botrytis paeoniae TaxID=278948 RepID=A0A4Z1G0X9_9HELO|nr:hypothetical protein BPAE_0038g00270 [Botrytis paeoniae]